jgi:hypothetical protein
MVVLSFTKKHHAVLHDYLLRARAGRRGAKRQAAIVLAPQAAPPSSGRTDDRLHQNLLHSSKFILSLSLVLHCNIFPFCINVPKCDRSHYAGCQVRASISAVVRNKTIQRSEIDFHKAGTLIALPLHRTTMTGPSGQATTRTRGRMA